MNWLLFLILLVITFFNFIVCKKDIMDPTVIVGAVFSLSAFMLCLNYEWGIQISGMTVAFISICVFVFSVGCLLGKKINICKSVREKDTKKKKAFFVTAAEVMNNLVISRKIFALGSILCIIVTVCFFLRQYNLSLLLGNTEGIRGIVGTIRLASRTDPEVFQLGMVLNVGIAFVRAAGYICIYVVTYKIIHKKGKHVKYFVPIVCLVINSIIATGRGAFISIVCAILFDIYHVRRMNGDKKVSAKFIKYIFGGVIVFLVVFWQLGTLTGQSAVWSLWETLSIYVGSPIICLDNLLDTGWVSSTDFGMHTFKGIYSMLKTFGFPVTVVGNHAEMFRWSGYSSNVYTSFFPYLLDFGIVITIVIQMFLGLIIGYVWKCYNECNTLRLFTGITYGRFWGSALVYFSIAERICTNMLALNVFVEIFFYSIFIRFLFKKRKSREATESIVS